MKLNEFKKAMSRARKSLVNTTLNDKSLGRVWTPGPVGACAVIDHHINELASDYFFETFSPDGFRRWEHWLGSKKAENLPLRLCFLDCFEAWATHEISGFAYKEF